MSSKRIVIITSGGDAPGMNAFIRAACRAALHEGWEVYGGRRGYEGLTNDDFVELDRAVTANRIARGGTFLGTARSMEFFTPEGRAKAAANLHKRGIDALIACGGDGTFRGAELLAAEHGIQVVGAPGTIDNDLVGCDYTIGYDTAVNTAAEAIDRIRDTAESHGRTFFIEVMGRHAGSIAMDVGVACGAEFIAVPETVTNLAEVCARMHREGPLRRFIGVIGEGDEEGDANMIAAKMKKDYGIEVKVTILGHIQRGGTPTVRDRILASRLGVAAVEAVRDGASNIMVGEVGSSIVHTPLAETFGTHKPIRPGILQLSEVLV